MRGRIRLFLARWPRGLIGAIVCLIVAPAGAAGWRPAQAPLMTRWAAAVRPESARPEYPRPQMVRKEWRSLNGPWEVALGTESTTADGGPWRPILVPFTYESALSGIGDGKRVRERLTYRRSFSLPEAWTRRIARTSSGRGDRVLLHFGAVDWEAVVMVNGRRLGTHRGGYTPFSFDVTEALTSTGPQQLVVAVYDPADPRRGAYQPKGKQLGSEGIWYTRTTGIWQTVWLELVPATYLSQLRLDADDRGELRVLGRVARPRPGLRLRVSIVPGWPNAEGAVDRSGVAKVHLRFAEARLWSPEEPNLYRLRMELLRGGKVVDAVGSYTGFRTYRVRQGRLALNGQPYFLRGVLDQGFWPDGIYTAPTDDALRADVAAAKAMGFNMARKHVKVEDPRWYYWCDRLGLAVWQDMPSSHNLASAEAKANFRRELAEVVEATRSHPSVLHWIPFNEDWGHPEAFQDEMVRMVRALDPSRPITDASGWTQRGLTDVIDAHNYSNRLLREGVSHPVKPKVVGEFGGIALPIPGHTWTTGWGYQTARTPDDLLRRLRSQVTQLFEAPNLSGFVYTQLTDVEQELNGLLTYDRLPKALPAKLAAIFTGRDRAHTDPGSYLSHWLVLGPIPTGARLTAAQPTPENERAMGEALDRPWVLDEAGLDPRPGERVSVDSREYTWRAGQMDGDMLDLNRTVGPATNSVAYAVTVIDLPRAEERVRLLFGSDDAAVVWLNGERIWRVNDTRGVDLDQDDVPGLRLRAGRNRLVVKVVQGVGGWGLAARLVRSDGTAVRELPPSH
jgi:Glycosyl hydrolases family 2, TIM barrel domain/Glycosyl hydrolases family 2/Glycosyl hydrolases family 2, sugar binding domain